MRDTSNRFRSLFDVADERGLTLPQPVLDAHRTLVNAEAAVAQPRPSQAEPATEGFIAAALAAASKGRAAPTATKVLDARRADEADALGRELGRRVQQVAFDDLLTTLQDHADKIVVEHLRPGFETAVDGARQTWPLFGHVGLDARDLLRADDDVRQAFLAFDDHVQAYWTARTAAGALYVILRVRSVDDDRGLFAVMRNGDDLWEQRYSPQGNRTPPPWPTSGRGHVEWIAAHPEAQPWLPTVEERNAAHQAWFERVRVDAPRQVAIG